VTENESRPEFFAGLMQPWIAQLHTITEELAGATRLSQSVLPQPLRSLQGLPLPGALSAAQLDSFARGVAAQRSSVAALQAQLAMFDEQLANVQEMVAPLVEWSKSWAEFERAAMNPGSGRSPAREDSG
jgi:hypothetical protein